MEEQKHQQLSNTVRIGERDAIKKKIEKKGNRAQY